jgi:hypothetical protein
MVATTTFNATRIPGKDQANRTESGSNLPFYAYFATLTKELSLQPGVDWEFAYSTIDVKDAVPGSTIASAKVDAFVPLIECEELKTSIGALEPMKDLASPGSNTTIPGMYQFPISLHGGPCNHWPPQMAGGNISDNPDEPPRSISGLNLPVYCESGLGTNATSKALDSWQLYFIADYQCTNTFCNITQATAVTCRTSHVMAKANAKLEMGESKHMSADIIDLGHALMENHTLPGLTDADVLTAFSAIDSWNEAFLTNVVNSSQLVASSLFSLLVLQEGKADLELLFDGARTKAAIVSVFKGVMAQYAQQRLTASAHIGVIGKLSFTENRLLVQTSAVWTLAIGFCCILGLLGFLIFKQPQAPLPRDPNSIASLAAFLTPGSVFHNQFAGLGNHCSAGPQSKRQSQDRTAALFKRFAKPQDLGSWACPPTCNGKTKPIWWRPLILRKWIITITLSLPAILILVLEILQRLSDRHNGICSVADSRSTNGLVRYMPALILVLTAALFKSLNFTATVLAPFDVLRSDYGGTAQVMLDDPLGDIPPNALIKSFINRYRNIPFARLGGIVGSILTIIVSGLYSINNIDTSARAELHRLDTFDLRWLNSMTEDNGAAGTTSLINNLGLAYPPYTFDEIVTPALSYDPPAQREASNRTWNSLWAQVPILRASLDCRSTAPGDIVVTAYPGFESLDNAGETTNASTTVISVSATLQLPPKCLLDEPHRNSTSLVYGVGFEGPTDSRGMYFAQLDNPRLMDTAVSLQDIELTQNLPTGCPSLVSIFGYFEGNATAQENVTLMLCYQRIQDLTANVTFLPQSPTFGTIAPNSPPDIFETTVEFVNATNTSEPQSFGYLIPQNIEEQFSWSSSLAHHSFDPFATRGTGYAESYDQFFDMIVHGPDAIPPDQLTGIDNQQRLFKAMNHLYRQYMAQAINLNMRRPCNGTVPTTASDGGCDVPLVDPLHVTFSQPRLVQNATSKLILQICLGTMAICGAMTYWLMETREILPQNPCSIAGKMCLLQGSEMCSRKFMPDGAEYMSDRDLKEIFGASRFRLGWWESKDGEGKRFGIDVLGKEEMEERGR